MKRGLKYAIVLAVLALAVFAAFTNAGLEAGSIIGLVRKPPSPVITVGEQRVPALLGTYSWRWLTSGICADSPSPYDMYNRQVKDGTAEAVLVRAKPGAEVRVSFHYPPYELGLNSWTGNSSHRLDGTAFRLPDEKGVYVYDIWARWGRGAGSFVFYIEVE